MSYSIHIPSKEKMIIKKELKQIKTEITRSCEICGNPTQNVEQRICKGCKDTIKEIKEIGNLKDYIKIMVSQEIKEQKLFHDANKPFKFSNLCICCGNPTENEKEYICNECKSNSSAGKDKW